MFCLFDGLLLLVTCAPLFSFLTLISYYGDSLIIAGVCHYFLHLLCI